MLEKMFWKVEIFCAVGVFKLIFRDREEGMGREREQERVEGWKEGRKEERERERERQKDRKKERKTEREKASEQHRFAVPLIYAFIS